MRCLLVNDGDLNIHSGLDGDGGDLSDDVSRRVHVDDSLVDSHLPSIISVRALTARWFTDNKLQELSRHADRAGHFKTLRLGFVLQHRAHLLKSLDLSGGEGDANSVDLDLLDLNGLKRKKELTTARKKKPGRQYK